MTHLMIRIRGRMAPNAQIYYALMFHVGPFTKWLSSETLLVTYICNRTHTKINKQNKPNQLKQIIITLIAWLTYFSFGHCCCRYCFLFLIHFTISINYDSLKRAAKCSGLARALCLLLTSWKTKWLCILSHPHYAV